MDHHKALKKLTFFSNPVPFNGQQYEKQKGIEVDQPVTLHITKQVQKSSLIGNIFIT